jgi:copper chaperone NosL
MKRHAFSCALALLVILLVGCQASDLSGPPQIRYGEDVCDQCNMIINEPRFAAAYVSEDGDTRRFDDIGEMFLYANDNNETVRTYWVHDYEDESWLEADGATYVHSSELMTPMGWALAAFSGEEEALAFSADRDGTVMTFDALRAGVLNGELMPQGMAQHNHE